MPVLRFLDIGAFLGGISIWKALFELNVSERVCSQKSKSFPFRNLFFHLVGWLEVKCAYSCSRPVMCMNVKDRFIFE